MPKQKTFFACQSCGFQAPKWMGKCPECGGWNTMVEERDAPERGVASQFVDNTRSRPTPIGEIHGEGEHRTSVGIGELDRVLGGGLVKGSVVLVGGDPGIGKSTLMLQAMEALAATGKRVLYVSGEESARQIKLRGERLGASSEGLLVLAENSLEDILRHASEAQPDAVVVDSIQTLYSPAISSAPGSISQVREGAGQLVVYAKKTGTPVFIVGHVTKDGSIAGPRVLEHMVDTVLYFEGDRGHAFRILRAVKNRFGSTNEIGVFEMKGAGLNEVKNPSEIFLAERRLNVTGSVVVSTVEGTRPIMAELQALVAPTTFGNPRRTAIGVDYGRFTLLLAVLEKRVGLHLMGQDVYVNVVGGLKVDEPSIDLGVIAAVASAFKDVPVSPSTVVMGEVGLGGEVRAIAQAEMRAYESGKLGFDRCVMPKSNVKKLPKIKGIEIIGVEQVDEALEIILA
ncbi:MAG: DNA repair protein RadA [Nitrospirota bacterium]